MRIVVPGNPEFRTLESESFDEWRLALEIPAVAMSDDGPGVPYVGRTRDGTKWALAMHSAETEPLSNARASGIVAFVIDPPKPHLDTIAEILFRTFQALRAGRPVAQSELDAIIGQCPFKVFDTVATLLPEAPASWLALPAELAVGFEPSENTIISDSTFRDYARSSFAEAITVLFAERAWGLLIGYTLVAKEVLPLLAWDVDWPLVRSGKTPPFKRERVQGIVPWRSEVDCKLLSIYQSVPSVGGTLAPHAFAKPVVRLRVGGRTEIEAVANWHQCAKALRRLMRRSV